MALLTVSLNHLILSQLARGEMRLLGLVVAVRKALGPSERIKGDLSATVKAALHKLILSKVVVESDGMFSLKV